jgi:hypothetical protein
MKKFFTFLANGYIISSYFFSLFKFSQEINDPENFNKSKFHCTTPLSTSYTYSFLFFAPISVPIHLLV